MLPSTEALRCFHAAAKTLHFRSAARSVALTPSAFGHRIRQLEAEIGEPLFLRSTRSVRLSRAGLALLPVAERALSALAECGRVGKGTPALPPTSLVLGTRHELGLSWLVPQIDALTAEHAWLDLHLYFGSGSDLVNRVRSFQLDAAITSTAISDPKLAWERLHPERYALVAGAALLKRTPIREPEDVAGLALVDIDDTLPLFHYWRDAPAAPALAYGRLVRFGTIEAIRMRVLAGAGIAVLPEYMIRDDLKARRLRALFPRVRPIEDHFRLVFRADDARRPMYEALARSFRAVPLR